MPTAATLEPQKLPDTSHVDYARVYEPSDDTFLLVDALTADAAALRAVRPAVCVEVGSGSGAVVTHLGRLLAASAPPPHVLATDVNRTAALATAATAAAAARRRPRCVTTAPLPDPTSTHTAGRTARSAAASAVSASTSRNVSSDGSYTRAKSTCEVSGSF